MKKYLNLEGQEIGWLKVLKLTDKKQGTTKLWECVCKCGNIVYKTGGKLNSAKKDNFNLSCGCSKNKENLIGKIYNDFKVVEYIKDLPNWNRLWKCQCLKCGNELEISTFSLKKNLNTCKKELKEKNEIQHYLHTCFLRIKNRCYNKNCENYKYYGEKGIKICKEWLDNSDNFVKWSLKNGFKLQKNEKGYNIMTIDRINNDKDYCPENCRWVTALEQANNKKINIFFEYKGEKKTLAQWCRELNLRYKYVHFLIKTKNKTFEEAINYKKRKRG